MSLDLAPRTARTTARTIALAPFDSTVRLLRWPLDADERAALAADGSPRLLVVAHDQPAPAVVDDLEDWIREPLDRAELAHRCATLEARAAAVDERPLVDDSGLVWFRDRWTNVPQLQVPLARALVERFAGVTTTHELSAAYADGGASPHPEAVKAAVARLRGHLTPIGLVVRTVRGRGFVLDVCDRA